MFQLQTGGTSECSPAVKKGLWESDVLVPAKDLLYVTTRTVHLSRHHNPTNLTKSIGETFVGT